MWIVYLVIGLVLGALITTIVAFIICAVEWRAVATREIHENRLRRYL